MAPGIAVVSLASGTMRLAAQLVTSSGSIRTGSTQSNASVEAHGDGCRHPKDNSSHDGGSGTDIRARYTTKDGTTVATPIPQVDEFLVPRLSSTSKTIRKSQRCRTAGLLSCGQTAAMAADVGGSTDVYGQRYDASGTEVGAEFLVNTYSDGTQYHSSIAAHGDTRGNLGRFERSGRNPWRIGP